MWNKSKIPNFKWSLYLFNLAKTLLHFEVLHVMALLVFSGKFKEVELVMSHVTQLEGFMEGWVASYAVFLCVSESICHTDTTSLRLTNKES